ncbi:hypothetical protein ACFL6Y_11595 [Elusimicrobiota bacterium]
MINKTLMIALSISLISNPLLSGDMDNHNLMGNQFEGVELSKREIKGITPININGLSSSKIMEHISELNLGTKTAEITPKKQKIAIDPDFKDHVGKGALIGAIPGVIISLGLTKMGHTIVNSFAGGLPFRYALLKGSPITVPVFLGCIAIGAGIGYTVWKVKD